MRERTPAEGIRRHLEEIRHLSDDHLIDRLDALEPLPDADDDDPAWLQDATWDRAEFLLAAAEVIGERRLVQAITPLFQRAALGDGNEMMQGLRHGPERAVAPSWETLTGIMRPLTRYHRAGCRRWAVRELGILRDPRTLDDLLAALGDEEPLVRSEACTSLSMLGPVLPQSARHQVRARLLDAGELDPSARVRLDALDAAETMS